MSGRVPADWAEAERIAQFLALCAPPTRADLAFVFGTRHPDPAYVAADLFKRGIIRYTVVTGGRNRLGVYEAEAHLRILMTRGVPRERIMVEGDSTNTLENVTFALPKIARRVPLQEIGSIAVIAKWYHCRRAVMTLKRYLPVGVRYYTSIYEPDGVRRADWYLDPEAARRVLKEWNRIPHYLEQGHIAEIRWDGDAFV